MIRKVTLILLLASLVNFSNCSIFEKKKKDNNLLLLGLAYLLTQQYEATVSIIGEVKNADGTELTNFRNSVALVALTNPTTSASVQGASTRKIITSTAVRDFTTRAYSSSTEGSGTPSDDNGNFGLTFTVDSSTGTLNGTATQCSGCSTTADYDSADKYTKALGTFNLVLKLAANGGTDLSQVTVTNASGLTVTITSVSVSIKGQYNLQSPTVGENICDGKNASGAGETLSGSISGNKTISGSATLSGTVTVESGATLTVAAGTVVFGNRGSSLFVKQGGKLVAEGTATNPICFTSAQSLGSRYPGDWGGIVLIGNGYTTRTSASTTEGTSPVSYGNGTNDSDSSGTLKYVIIEFAGNEVAPGDELNGLSMYAVGSGTTVDYVQVHRGLDDSFEMWGGAVKLTHVVATGGLDDDYDMDEGYTGSVTYAIGQKYPVACGGSPSTDPSGIEADGAHNGNGANCPSAPRRCTNGPLSYMTMIGQNITSGDAARLREGNAQTISNSVFYNYSPSAIINGEFTGTFPNNSWTLQNTVYLPTGKTVTTNNGTDNSQKTLSAVPVVSVGDVANCGFAATKPDFTTNTASGAPSTVGASANGQGSWWSNWTVYRAR